MNNLSPKVLIVDDDSTIRTVFKLFLPSVNYEIAGEAVNGNDAITKFNELSPDIMLLDINMPEKTGYQVLTEIKDKALGTCIIMVSQLSEIDVVKKCVDLGAFYYIKKDMSFPQMVQVVQNCWEKFKLIKLKNDKVAQENQQNNVQIKIIEDTFVFILNDRKIMNKDTSQKMIGELGSAYNLFLSLREGNTVLKEDLGWIWATAMNCTYVNHPVNSELELLRKFPKKLAQEYGAIPIYRINKTICIAFSKILSEKDKKHISEIFKDQEISYVFSFPEDVTAAINNAYPSKTVR